MTEKVVLLGSTGSIGVSAFSVIRELGFTIVGLSTNRNIELLEEQARESLPRVVGVRDGERADELKERLKGLPVSVLSGDDAAIEIAQLPDAETVLVAISGSASLLPTISAIRAKKRIALSSKEALVCAGSIVMREAKERDIQIIPIDSEHSAIFQCLEGKKPVRIILTASGGPFLDREELESVTPEEALSHPTWSMGRRITIDSATLMNKGFEVIEAVWLFGVDPDQIEVVIHPQSILHSAVEFSDGTVMGCMSVADMRLPISYALKYPERAERLVKRLDLTEVGRLTFEKPDFVRFPCLSLSYSAIEAGGTMPTVLNAADEVAIDGFLEKKIPFSEIPSIIERTMEKHRPKQNPELCDILSADKWAREVAQKIMASMR